MAHDVIVDRYARLYELPYQLTAHGNAVQCVCLSYQGHKNQTLSHSVEGNSQLEWHSFNAGPFGVLGLPAYIRQVKKLVSTFQPDLLLASSDCLHVVLVACFAKLANKPYVVDLYDNYASFGMAKIPGLLPLYHWALKNAHGVCCVSQPLAESVWQNYQADSLLTLESTINLADFYPQDQKSARLALDLPTNAKLIGVAGSLNRERGITLLYDSFMQLANKYPDLHLVLAGSIDADCPIPNHERCHYLGLLPHQKIVHFYNALDLAVVCMRDTEFGRYAFPQKTYEILACKTPVVTAKLGALQETFKAYPECLYEPDNQADLKAKIEGQLQNPTRMAIPIPSWREQGVLLSHWLQGILAKRVG